MTLGDEETRPFYRKKAFLISALAVAGCLVIATGAFSALNSDTGYKTDTDTKKNSTKDKSPTTQPLPASSDKLSDQSPAASDPADKKNLLLNDLLKRRPPIAPIEPETTTGTTPVSTSTEAPAKPTYGTLDDATQKAKMNSVLGSMLSSSRLKGRTETDASNSALTPIPANHSTSLHSAEKPAPKKEAPRPRPPLSIQDNPLFKKMAEASENGSVFIATKSTKGTDSAPHATSRSTEKPLASSSNSIQPTTGKAPAKPRGNLMDELNSKIKGRQSQPSSDI